MNKNEYDQALEAMLEAWEQYQETLNNEINTPPAPMFQVAFMAGFEYKSEVTK